LDIELDKHFDSLLDGKPNIQSKIEKQPAQNPLIMIQTIIDQFTKLISLAQLDADKGWQYRVKNYQKVLKILKTDSKTTPLTNLTEIVTLLQTNGVGKKDKPPYKNSIIIKIKNILDGNMVVDPEHNQRLINYNEILSIPEVGPSKAKQLLLEGKTLSDLMADPSLLNRKQQIGLRYYHDLQTRIPRSEMEFWLQTLSTATKQTCKELDISESIVKMDLTGSYRRGHLDSGDVDFYIAIPETHIKNFMSTLVDCLIKFNILNRADIFSQGDKKMMSVARLTDKHLARHLDVFIFPIHQYPFAILFATGSGEFNVKMRQFALKHGWSLSDKALLLKNNKGRPPNQQELQSKGLLSIQTENDIFRFLSRDFVEPHLRTPKYLFN
jgi:DNA polymerase/3'-5' exonuclease PolX